MTEPIRILVVDDSQDDCDLSLREIQRAGLTIVWERVEDEPSLRAAITRQNWQVVLLDHAMPRLDGARALAVVREIAPDVIPIVVSGSIGEDRAVDAIRRGARDYVLKDRLVRLPAAIRRELAQADERRARMDAESLVREMARRDAVTGLPNRVVLEEAIESRLRSAEASTTSFGVVVMELERFTTILKAFGHAVGDEVVRSVARRLDSTRSNGATLATLGVHDFGLLIPEADPQRLGAECDRIRSLLDEPVLLAGVPIRVEATCGIAHCPGHGTKAATLLRSASLAMHEARRLGQPWSMYRARNASAESEELILLGELSSAIDSRELSLAFQPILDLQSCEPVAAEALVRWQHPTRGLIPPGRFVPQAESCALIQPLTRLVLRGAAEWIAQVRPDGKPTSVAVNVAARNLLDAGFVDAVREELANLNLSASALELEITESALMADPQRARETLERLRELGVRLAIDDFGTGYSSFAYLRDLPVHKVKIDRSFVARLTESKSDAAIVQGVIDLAHTLGLLVVAEGIEDQLSLDLLAAFGCDFVQGYYIGRPMPADGFREWLHQWTASGRGGELRGCRVASAKD